MSMVKPRRLRRGSRVAAVSLSWGGPGAFIHRYAAGKRQFEEEFGVSVIETEHALRDPEWLSRNPRARADDLMAAFADPTIDGVISTIGGDDSIRILPYVNLDLIRNNPKVFMGYSDTSVTHCVCRQAGLVSFYGPSFMAGLAESGGMSRYLVDSLYRTLFRAVPIGVLAPNETGWTVEEQDWSNPAHLSVKRHLNPPGGSFIRGTVLPRARYSAGAFQYWIGFAELLSFPRQTHSTAPFCSWRPRRMRHHRRCSPRSHAASPRWTFCAGSTALSSGAPADR